VKADRRARRASTTAFAAAAIVLSLGGCAAPFGPPAIRLGAPCAACGMQVQDLRFACERGSARRYRVYDSIECLLRDAAAIPAGTVYLADYDQSALHAADSMWVVRGDFPTPMGGGYAAFLERAAADRVAAATRGRVDRLGAFGDSARGTRS
jgi:nitrous oxide reductase accessory protein NosL